MVLKGTYCLIINLEDDNLIKVGSLGEILFKKGYYVYVGSAMNSLIARLRRHLSDDKKIHWHVDYLLLNKSSHISDIIYTTSEKKVECLLSTKIKESTDFIPQFGCSDCDCKSHLFYFNNQESSQNIIKNAYDSLDLEYFNLDDLKKLLI